MPFANVQTPVQAKGLEVGQKPAEVEIPPVDLEIIY